MGKRATTATEHKLSPLYIVNADDAEGIIEAVVNVFGIIDLGSDMIHNGAYTKTLNERGNQVKVRVLDSHNTDSILRVIGKPLEIREIGRDELARIAPKVLQDHPEATGGLYTKTQFLLNTPEGDGAYKRLASGAVDEWSIALDALQVDYGKAMTPEGKEVTVRHIYQIRLYEYSPVIWGMNQATATTAVKTVISYQNLPLAPQDRAWDSAAAEGRVREWAGGADNPDWNQYARAFFWHDGENVEQFGSYKLGYADVIDGELRAVPRGIFAVAGILQGARGGVDIPDAEQSSIKNQVARYYQKMSDAFGEDLIPPWDKAADTTPDSEKQATLISRLEADMRMSAAFRINDWLSCGEIDPETVAMLFDAVNTAMNTLRDAIPAGIAMMPMREYWGIDDSTLAAKAGRMISGANRDQIQQVIDILQALMDASAPEDMSKASQDEKAQSETPVSPLTGSPAEGKSLPSASIDDVAVNDVAAIERERQALAILMEMSG